MNALSQFNLARCLAHSAVFFSREAWKPVQDAVNGPTASSSSSNETASNQQVAGQGGAAGSTNIVSGASSTKNGNIGGGAGSTNIVSIQSSDPDVLEAAMAANQNVSDTALESMGEDALNFANDATTTATQALTASTNQVVANDEFALGAIDAAANEDADATTAVEAASTGSQVTAQDALAAAQNTLTAGVAPSQEFQTTGTASLQAQTQSWATWIGIIAGGLSIVYYLFYRKKS